MDCNDNKNNYKYDLIEQITADIPPSLGLYGDTNANDTGKLDLVSKIQQEQEQKKEEQEELGEEGVELKKQQTAMEKYQKQQKMQKEKNKGLVAKVIDYTINKLKEPLVIVAVVFIINLAPIRRLVVSYSPTQSVLLFNLYKAVLIAIGFVLTKQYILPRLNKHWVIE